MFDTIKKINLQLFAEMNTMTTGTASLSDEMKTFYSDYLIDNAKPKLVHDQFGQKCTMIKESVIGNSVM